MTMGSTWSAQDKDHEQSKPESERQEGVGQEAAVSSRVVEESIRCQYNFERGRHVRNAEAPQ
jgi:hypothetical protein